MPKHLNKTVCASRIYFCSGGQVIWVFDTPCLWGNDTNPATCFCSTTDWWH